MVTSYPIRPAPSSQYAFQDPQQITIQAWAEEASRVTSAPTNGVAANESSRGIRGASVKLEIPLDRPHPAITKSAVDDNTEAKLLRLPGGASRSPSEPLRRDSLKRREALLKGKEGSRRRQRWENGEYLLVA